MTERTGAVMSSSTVDLSLRPMDDTQDQQQKGHMGQRVVVPVQTLDVTYNQLCFAFTVALVVGVLLLAMTLHMGNGPDNPWLRNLLGFGNGTNSTHGTNSN